jgi:hypothetical protein
LDCSAIEEKGGGGEEEKEEEEEEDDYNDVYINLYIFG